MTVGPLPDEIEQFEREQEQRAEARQIVLQWLQAIDTASRTGEELALLGYGSEGMEIALAALRLGHNPPVEYLQLLIDAASPPQRDR